MNVPCTSGEREFAAVLKNVTPDGLGIETDEPLRKGQQLCVDGLPCQVRWSRKVPQQTRRHAGLLLLTGPELLARSWLSRLFATLQELSQDRRPDIGVEPAEAPALRPELAVVRSEKEVEPSALSPLPRSFDAASDSETTPDATATLSVLELHAGPALEELPAADVEAALAAESEVAPTLAKSDLPQAEVDSEVESGPGDQQQAEVDPSFLVLLAEAQRLTHNSQGLLGRALKGFRSFAFEDKASLLERRRIARIHQAVTLVGWIGKEQFEATALDLTPAGLGLKTSHRLYRGQAVQLRSAEFEGSAVAATVCYARPVESMSRVGLALRARLDGSWLATALQQLGFQGGHLERSRHFVRVETRLPVEVRTVQGDYVTSYFLDIGQGGAMLLSSGNWPPGESLRLVLGPMAGLPVVYLSATVLHQQPAEDDQWMMRLRFLDMPPTHAQRLNQYLKALLAAKGRRL